MAITAKTGTGTTVTFSGGFTCKIINVDPFAIALESIDANNMSSVDWMQKLPADLADLGEMSMEIEYDPTAEPPIGTVETITIDPKALGTGKKIVGSGFISGYTASIPVNGKMTATITVTWDGTAFEIAAA